MFTHKLASISFMPLASCIRTDTAWSQVKTKIQPLGSVALSVVAEVAKSLALSKLGL